MVVLEVVGRPGLGLLQGLILLGVHRLLFHTAP
jgi:hypothetical protein